VCLKIKKKTKETEYDGMGVNVWSWRFEDTNQLSCAWYVSKLFPASLVSFAPEVKVSGA